MEEKKAFSVFTNGWWRVDFVRRTDALGREKASHAPAREKLSHTPAVPEKLSHTPAVL